MIKPRTMWRVLVFVCIGAALVAVGLGRAHMARGEATDQRKAPARAQADSAAIAAALSKRLSDGRPPLLRSDEWATVARVYRGADLSSAPVPLWGGEEHIQRRGGELIATLAAADSFGLSPNDYAIGDVESALKGAADAGDATKLAQAEVLLTASFVGLLDDMLLGRVDPKKVVRAWHIAPSRVAAERRVMAAAAALRAGKAIGEIVKELRPDYGVGAPLMAGLARYRAIADAGGWKRLSPGPTLRQGDSGAVVGALRQRLATEGFTATGPEIDRFDDALVAAVADFQRRHGLTVDSAVGPATRKALNVSVAHRIEQIEANIERLRWLPVDLGERFVVVNIPAFSLYGYVGGERRLTMRVVVGDELVSRRTPIFADTLEYVEFGPYWNVPRSIAVNEILPAARRDRDYLRRNRFQILRGWGDNAPVVDPRSLSDAALFSSRYRVRQLPGPNNALGRVKFIFPNDFNIYLHDTPSKLLFESADRAHSHGCIRVADPQALAEFVLHDRPDWTSDRIASTLQSGRRLQVRPTDAVPVYLVYLTALVREGDVAFRDDIYDRDDSLIRALRARARTVGKTSASTMRSDTTALLRTQ